MANEFQIKPAIPDELDIIIKSGEETQRQLSEIPKPKYPTFEEELSRVDETGKQNAMGAEYDYLRNKLAAVPEKIKADTDAVVQAKALSSLMSNLIKAFAAAEGARRGIDMSGVDVKSGVDWDTVLKGKLSALEEERRGAEQGKEEVRMTLADRIRAQREAADLEYRTKREEIAAAGRIRTDVLMERWRSKEAERRQREQLAASGKATAASQARLDLDILKQQDRIITSKDAQLLQKDKQLSSSIYALQQFAQRSKGRISSLTEDALLTTHSDLITPEVKESLKEAGIFDKFFGEGKSYNMDANIKDPMGAIVAEINARRSAIAQARQDLMTARENLQQTMAQELGSAKIKPKEQPKESATRSAPAAAAKKPKVPRSVDDILKIDGRTYKVTKVDEYGNVLAVDEIK